MPTYPFLSDQWITECRALREQHAAAVVTASTAAGKAMPKLKMNLVVNGVPFDTGSIDAHFDTSQGEPEIELGHIDNAELTVTVDYATAKTVFVEGNLGAAMAGLQQGKIKVTGNTLKLMSLAGMRGDEPSKELARKIQEITE